MKDANGRNNLKVPAFFMVSKETPRLSCWSPLGVLPPLSLFLWKISLKT